MRIAPTWKMCSKMFQLNEWYTYWMWQLFWDFYLFFTGSLGTRKKWDKTTKEHNESVCKVCTGVSCLPFQPQHIQGDVHQRKRRAQTNNELLKRFVQGESSAETGDVASCRWLKKGRPNLRCKAVFAQRYRCLQHLWLRIKLKTFESLGQDTSITHRVSASADGHWLNKSMW